MGAPARSVWAFDRKGTTRTDPSAGTLKTYAARSADLPGRQGKAVSGACRFRRRFLWFGAGAGGEADVVDLVDRDQPGAGVGADPADV